MKMGIKVTIMFTIMFSGVAANFTIRLSSNGNNFTLIIFLRVPNDKY